MSAPSYSDPLSDAQDRLVVAIKNAPLVVACQTKVEPERRGDIEQVIANALNKLGAAVVVLEPIGGTLPDPDTPDLITEVEFVVECAENVLLNRREPVTEDEPPHATALQLLQAVLHVHDAPTGLLNAHHPLGRWRLRPEAFRRLPHKTLSIYQASFTAGVDLNPAQP